MTARRRPAVLLLPTERHAEAGGPGATTLPRFFDRLASELDVGARAATRAERRAAARAALEASSADDPLRRLFDRGAHERTAIVTALDHTFGELLAAGTTVDDLLGAGTPRGRALGGALDRANQALAGAGRADRRGLGDARALSRRLPEIAFDHVAVAGTLDVGGALLERLLLLHRASRAAGGRGATLRLPRPDDADGSLASVATILERRLARELDAPEIDWLEPRTPIASVVEARSPDAEARAAAHAAARALDAGAPPERVAIAVPPGDEALLGPLRAALREAGVPFSEDRGPPAEAVPEARAALSLLGMAAGTITKDGLTELLRLPGLHAGSFVGAPEERAAAERARVLAHHLRELPVVRDGSGARFVESLRGAHPREPWLADAAGRLCAIIAGLRGRRGLASIGRAWLDATHALRLGEPSAREIGRGVRSGGPDLLRSLGVGSMAVRALRRAAEDLISASVEVGRSDAIGTVEDLHAELAEALASTRVGARGASGRAGTVRVGRPAEIAGLDHDLVVVTRLGTSGYRAPRRSSLLDDATRGALPADRRPRGLRERATLADAELLWAAAAAPRVVLTHASADDDGREADPPHALVTLALSRGAARSIEPSSRVSPRACVLSPRGADLAALASGAPPDGALRARVDAEVERQRFFVEPVAPAGAYSGAISAALSARLVAAFGGSSAEAPISVTAVEAAASCPFKAFGRRVLRASPIEDALDELTPRARGDLLHRALHAAYDAEAALPPSASIEARVAAGQRAAEEAIGWAEPEGPLRREAKRRVLEDAIELLRRDLASPRDLRYHRGELTFGPKAAPPWGALELPHPDLGSVWVEGRIDRVDLSADRLRARVVDYKSGKSLQSKKQLGVTSFQLPLYARVVERLGAAQVGVAYLVVPLVLSGAQPIDEVAALPAEKRDEAAGRAADIVRRLWSGDVAPRPSRPASCRKCDARDLCRRPAVVPTTDAQDGDDA